MIEAIAFYLFAGVAIVAATLVVTLRNPVHSVLFLILAFFNAAGLFILLEAEFLAMILVVVYVGAVAVLFMFVVMMLDINFVQLRQGFLTYLPIGLVVSIILLAELLGVAGVWYFADEAQHMVVAPIKTDNSNAHALGEVLYTDYIYLFQAAGLVLLVAMIGAIVLTHRQRTDVKRQNVAKQLAHRVEDSVEMKKVKIGKGI